MDTWTLIEFDISYEYFLHDGLRSTISCFRKEINSLPSDLLIMVLDVVARRLLSLSTLQIQWLKISLLMPFQMNNFVKLNNIRMFIPVELSDEPFQFRTSKIKLFLFSMLKNDRPIHCVGWSNIKFYKLREILSFII